MLTVDLAPDEIITAVRFAPVRAAAYAKLYQRLAVRDRRRSGRARRQRRRDSLGAYRSHRRRLARRPSDHRRSGARRTRADAARLAGSDLEDVNEDIHASEAYRRAMIPVFTRRALDGALVRLTAQS